MNATKIFRLSLTVLFAYMCGLADVAAQGRRQTYDRQQRRSDRNNGIGSQTQPATSQPALEQGFDGFRMVLTRNIFDPDRRPIPIANQGPQREQSPPPTHSDYVALTGIMVTDDKALAFFSGTRADYNKVLAVDADIAGAKLTKITTTNIEVERDGKRTVVAIGQTVPLDGSAPVEAPSNLPPPVVTGTAAPSTNAPPSDASDVLRRMMERRQEQLK